MLEDTYKSIQKPAKGFYKEKGSKFLSFAYPINDENEFKKIQNHINKKFYNARHRCYAYQVGYNKELYRVNDDGEPSNSAGKPILGQINSNDLTNILIYVIRYFGGTLLGIGGLINAYKNSAADAIDNSEIITKTIQNIYAINFKYTSIGIVMKTLKENGIKHFDQNFSENCSVKISVRKNYTEKIIEKLNNIKNIELEYLKTI